MPQNKKPEFIASITGWNRPERFARTIEELDEIDYDGIEMQAHGFDDWLEYPTLTRLNEYKRYAPDHLAAMRRCFEMLKNRDKRIGLWTHELWTPAEILDVYPELRTPRGDINLSHPALAEFVRARLERFFEIAPEIDFIVFSMTETTWPVMHRFDNEMDPVECVRWIIGIYDEVFKRRGRELVVRPFSANTIDYDIVRSALESFPHLTVMEKSDPFDWDMHLPLNPYLGYYPGRRKVMEFDISAEYFGCNRLPAVALSYIKERLEYGESLGVEVYSARITRYGHNTLTTINRPNALYASQFFTLEDRDPASYLRRVAPEVYPAAKDPVALCELLEGAWRVIERTFYVNGQLMIDAFWGQLKTLINNVFFEMTRPDHSLAHADRQWPILGDRPTPSAGEIRREKDEALADAKALLTMVKEVAPDETEVVSAFEELILIVELFRSLAFLGQAYVREIERPEGSIEEEVRDFRDVAEKMRREKGERYFGERVRGGLPASADSMADEFEIAFSAEKKLRAKYGAEPDIEDFILPGFPAEGHLPSKTSHGATAFIEGDRWARKITNDTLSYTSRLSPGGKIVELEVKGRGRLKIFGQTMLEFEEDDWRKLSFELDIPGSAADSNQTNESADKGYPVEFVFSRTGSPPPAVRLIAIRRKPDA